MGVYSYETLRLHIGHVINCVCYGVPDMDPHNVAVECETCGEVLFDFDHPDVNAEEGA